MIGCVALLVVCAGFGRSFLGTVTGRAPLSLLVSIHSVVFLAWLVLFVLQAALVMKGRTDIHRKLGITSMLLAVLMVGLGYVTAIQAARRGFDLPLDNEGTDPLRFLVFTLGDLLSFSVLIAAALWFRSRTEVHKRLMLLAVVGPMMGAPLAHFFALAHFLPARTPFFVGAMAVLLFSGAAYDRLSRGRFDAVSLWGAVALFVYGNLRAALIGPSETWHRFAEWIIR